MYKGIDISHYQNQKGIDWPTLAKEIDFVFIKATEGKTYVDPYFKSNATNAKKYKIPFGFYHFARFTNETDAKKEAEFFYSKVKALEPFDLPLVLDIEVKPDSLSWTTLKKACQAFLDHLKELSKKRVMYYCNKYYYENLRLDGYELWIARPTDASDPGVPNWIVWQYSSTGKIKGISGNVDLDYATDELFQKNTSNSKTSKPKTSKPSTSSPSSEDEYYTIQKGDTFWGIEEKKRLKHGTLAKLNPKVDPNRLKIGSKILIRKGTTSKTTSKHYPVPNATLKRGDKGKNVLQMQEALSAIHFYPDKDAKNHGCDGIFGAKTEDCVKRFQSVYCSPVDGIFGPKTRTALINQLKKANLY